MNIYQQLIIAPIHLRYFWCIILLILFWKFPEVMTPKIKAPCRQKWPYSFFCKNLCTSTRPYSNLRQGFKSSYLLFCAVRYVKIHSTLEMSMKSQVMFQVFSLVNLAWKPILPFQKLLYDLVNIQKFLQKKL